MNVLFAAFPNDSNSYSGPTDDQYMDDQFYVDPSPVMPFFDNDDQPGNHLSIGNVEETVNLVVVEEHSETQSPKKTEVLQAAKVNQESYPRKRKYVRHAPLTTKKSVNTEKWEKTVKKMCKQW